MPAQVLLSHSVMCFCNDQSGREEWQGIAHLKLRFDFILLLHSFHKVSLLSTSNASYASHWKFVCMYISAKYIKTKTISLFKGTLQLWDNFWQLKAF